MKGNPGWWLPALAWAATIVWVSASPDARGVGWMTDLFFQADKVIHAGVFGILAVFVLLATGRPALSVVLVSLFGAADELHQATVPGRDADVFDWVADTMGALIAVALVVYLTRRRSRSPQRLQ